MTVDSIRPASTDDAPVHSFQPLDHPLVFDQPRRLTDVASWHEHIPFAFFAVAALRPDVFVELGTHKGDSYCAFCQAVDSLHLPARCYAVDTWQGDDQSGLYGPDVLEELRAYHDPLYGSFSSLLQQTFDEAHSRFIGGSIDLLHVDGCHTYEAVRHDVETWLPKLSDRGVVLLHDTNVREESFGVWRLWDDLSERYPSFAFAHGHGLGVLAVGPRVGESFRNFLALAGRGSPASRFFSTLGERIAAPALERRTALAAEVAAAEVREAIERESEQRLRLADGLRAEAERVGVERDRVATQLRAREDDLTGIIGSISWRVTAPLRTWKHDLQRLRRLAKRVRRGRLPRVRAGGGQGEPVSLAPRPQVNLADLSQRPLVSILTPVYNTDPKWLSRAVESVRRQTYPRWQLCLADDGSTNAPTLDYLRSVGSDPAVEVIRSDARGGIATASNRALAAATGEFVAFLDHDDELHPDALLECVARVNEQPAADAIYTDEDKVDRHGRHSEPFHKPDWSPELFRGVMYVGHFLFVRRSLVEEIGGLDSTYDGVQDFELMLRVSERTDRIEHIPRVLYHWRKLPGSVARSTHAKEGIAERQAAAVNAHLERCGIPAVAEPNPELPHRAVLQPKPRNDWPRVTVIIPTKDAPAQIARCLESIYGRSTYPNFEVLLIDNGTTDTEARRLFERHPVRVLPFDGAFNFSRANNLGVEHADSEFVVFLNNDTEVETPGWLEAMIGLAELDGVGAVGAQLLYPNGTIQHAGVVLGIRGTADHIMRGFDRSVDGYAGSLSCTREVSAVTGACMVVRRILYLAVGGFDEHYATHYQDVDLCLRIRETGRRNLYTPRAVLVHHESATRGSGYDHLDRALLLDAWGETIARGDPYYNPLLSLSGADYRPRATAA